MSEATANKVVDNKNDAKVTAKNPDTTSDAKSTLSNSVQDMMKDAVANGAGKAASSADAADSASKLGNELGKAAGSEATGKLGKTLNQLDKEGMAGKIADGISNMHEGQKQIDKSGALENIEKGGMSIGDFAKKMNVTDQDRKEAKEALEKGISGLVPEGDRKAQVAIQNAIIDGDMGKFKEAIKAVGNDPEKLAKMVKEVNDQLNRNEKFGGVELSMDSKGNVLLYGEKGNTAVSVNPKTGDTTLRAVERQADGSVVLKDGEIINRKPEEVMKTLGDEATRSITEWPHFSYPIEKPFPHFEPKPRFDEKPHWNDKPTHPNWNDKPSLKEKLENGHLDFTPLKGFENKKADDK